MRWTLFWAALAVAYFGTLLMQPPGLYDEGMIVSGAERVLQGQMPYRDFYACYPPGQFYTIAGVFSTFGSSLLVERIWDTLWRLAIIVFIVLLARTALEGRRPPPLPLVCAGLVTGASGYYLYPTIAAMLPCVAGLWCAVEGLKTRSLRWIFLAGFFSGLGGLYRHDLAACVAGAVTLTLCYLGKAGEKQRCLQLVLVFWAGVLIILIVPGLYFWLSVPHNALLQAFVEFPRITFSSRYHPVPGPGSLLAWTDFYMPIAIILAAAATFRQRVARMPALMLLLVTSLLALALAVQRVDIAHSYPAIMFSLVLLCMCIADWRLESRHTFLLPLLLSGVILCYGFVPLVVWRWQMTRERYAVPTDVVRAGPIHLEADQWHAIRYIQRHLAPGKFLYVGVEPHTSAHNNDCLFYFLADRPTATRFDWFLPGVTSSPAVQSEMLENIRQKQVEYVMLLSLFRSKTPSNIETDPGENILDDGIRRDYAQVAEFGNYTIWHVRSMQ